MEAQTNDGIVALWCQQPDVSTDHKSQWEGKEHNHHHPHFGVGRRWEEGEPMMEGPSRSKMALAFQVAAGNVEKKKKQETNGEMHKRIMEEQEAKLNRGVKKAARTMVKKKQIKKLTAYFGKK